MPVVIDVKPAVQRSNLDLIGLEDLVAPGSAPKGFYVASGSHHLVKEVLSRVVDLFKAESEQTAVHIQNQTHAGRLFWIDSGNSFDAYHVSRMAAQRGMDPRRVLRAIQVARPFTAFQFQQMLNKVPLSPTLSQGEGSRVSFTPLVIISDLMGLFYDEEIQEKDLQRAFHSFISSLSALGDRALVLALNMDYSIPFERRALVSRTLAMAKKVTLTPKIPAMVSANIPAEPFSGRFAA